MLELEISTAERFDEELEVFIPSRSGRLLLEHSLLSLSRWEAETHKPFITSEEKSYEETLFYIRCMTVNKPDPRLYDALGAGDIAQIQSYINDSHTATTFQGGSQQQRRQIVTSELIYYWMVAAGIPFECEKWHLNRLLTLIRIAGIKSSPGKKRSAQSISNEYWELNQARRAAAGKV